MALGRVRPCPDSQLPCRHSRRDGFIDCGAETFDFGENIDVFCLPDVWLGLGVALRETLMPGTSWLLTEAKLPARIKSCQVGEEALDQIEPRTTRSA